MINMSTAISTITDRALSRRVSMLQWHKGFDFVAGIGKPTAAPQPSASKDNMDRASN